jgi:hypothetical protein
MKIDFGEHEQINRAIYRFAQLYLDKRGWFESADGTPRNKDGVVPWITYPAFRQLVRIVKPGCRVFEYGCGGSSLWWAARASEVVSVENDAEWAVRFARAAPENLKIIVRKMGEECSEARRAEVAEFFAEPPELPISPERKHNLAHGFLSEEFVAYATEITEYPRASFDVVVIDGMARTLTAWLAARYVKPTGIIVFDNSDRWQYNGAYRLLRDAGFRRIDYYGPGPLNCHEWCTSLFVKDLDVFQASVDSPEGDGDVHW